MISSIVNEILAVPPPNTPRTQNRPGTATSPASPNPRPRQQHHTPTPPRPNQGPPKTPPPITTKPKRASQPPPHPDTIENHKQLICSSSKKIRRETTIPTPVPSMRDENTNIHLRLYIPIPFMPTYYPFRKSLSPIFNKFWGTPFTPLNKWGLPVWLFEAKL